VEKQIAMSVAFSSKIKCGLLSLAKVSQTSSNSGGCGVALQSVQPCWAVFLLL